MIPKVAWKVLILRAKDDKEKAELKAIAIDRVLQMMGMIGTGLIRLREIRLAHFIGAIMVFVFGSRKLYSLRNGAVHDLCVIRALKKEKDPQLLNEYNKLSFLRNNA